MNETCALLTTDEVLSWVSRLASLTSDVDDAERVRQLGVLESLKSAAAAAQARVAVAFDASQRQGQRAAGMPAAKLGAGIAEQVALARRESPSRGSRLLGLAKALVEEMPHTLSALVEGRISEWRATLVVKQTAVLTRQDRASVDARLAGQLDGTSDKAVAAAARRAAYELDPQAALEYGRRAVAERRVTIRPALDLMANVSGFLPLAQGVAAYAALRKHAETMRAQGDERSLEQLMADTFVERLTGQARAAAVPVEVHLVMTGASLLGQDHTPATVRHYGPVPAATARDLIRQGAEADAQAWVRRLITDPLTGTVVDTERRRTFSAAVRRVVLARDEWCRTPWCGAPIRHIDHVTPFASGGATDLSNAQGLCERCNYAKQAPGWRVAIVPDGESPTRVRITTPTGHTYDSTAPAGVAGGHGPPAQTKTSA
ncbi:MAG: DUF222 domain-containing protein [Dermatophilaceae bacterium]